MGLFIWLREKEEGVCVYCCQESNITRDHVFPRALFNPPYPQDNIIVDSCRKCNNSFSKDEEFFRTMIAARATFTKAGQKLWHNKVVESTFRRSPKLKTQIGKSIIDVDVYSKGGILLGQLPAIPIDRINERRMERVVNKMIRGLYHHHYNKIVDNSIKTQITFIDKLDSEFEQLLKKLKRNTIGNGRIIYWYGKVPEFDFVSFWGILFYNSLISNVMVYPANMENELFQLND